MHALTLWFSHSCRSVFVWYLHNNIKWANRKTWIVETCCASTIAFKWMFANVYSKRKRVKATRIWLGERPNGTLIRWYSVVCVCLQYTHFNMGRKVKINACTNINISGYLSTGRAGWPRKWFQYVKNSIYFSHKKYYYCVILKWAHILNAFTFFILFSFFSSLLTQHPAYHVENSGA